MSLVTIMEADWGHMKGFFPLGDFLSNSDVVYQNLEIFFPQNYNSFLRILKEENSFSEVFNLKKRDKPGFSEKLKVSHEVSIAFKPG